MTRIGILLAGSFGLAAIARAALYYAGIDAIALALVITMAVGLALGLAELLGRVQRFSTLTSELASLPTPAADDTVSRASLALRPFLRARIENLATPTGGPVFAPYVVGLLVMLGLLGTFLGLFETLRGAREALTSSTDVDALRAGLARPMEGLTRSFGTSAAGVASSAALGLATVLARRVESGFARVLHAYAVGALATLTTPHRTLAALEALVRHGQALPQAAGSLDQAARKLDQLEQVWRASHEQAAQETSRAIGAAAASIGADLKASIAHVASSVSGEHLAQLRADVESETVARRAREASHAKMLEAAVTQAVRAEETRATALGARWESMTAAVGTALNDASARHAEHARDMTEAAEKVHHVALRALASGQAQMEVLMADLRAVAEGDAEKRRAHAEAHARALEAAAGQLTRAEETRAAALGARWESLTVAMGTALDDSRAKHAEHTRALAETAGAVHEGALRALASGQAQMEAFVTELRALGELESEERRARDEAHAKALATTVTTSAQAEEARVTALGARWESLTAAMGAALDASTARHAEHAHALSAMARTVHEGAAEALASERAQMDTLAQRHEVLHGHLEQLVVRVDARSEALAAELSTAAQQVAEAADLLRAGGGELGAVAEAFAVAVDRHGEASSAWLESLAVVEVAVDEAGERAAAGALGETLARMHEAFDRQLQVQHELFTQLRALRVATAMAPVSESRRGTDAPV